MTRLDDNLSKILDIEPLSDKTVPTIVPIPVTDSAQDDFELARNTIKNMMLKGEEVLDELVIVAKESESPRAYEVASTLIKTVTEAAKDMLEVHKRISDIKGKSPESNPSSINVEQAVFVGSTTELQELIKQQRKLSNV
jgi:predicted transcriptional regulator